MFTKKVIISNFLLFHLIKKVWNSRKILLVTTKYELQKKYAGSLLGIIWVILYPLLFLCIYLFLYLVVFKVRFPSMSSFEYVVYVFSGLVPFICLMDVVNTSTVSMRQNSHLIKNVIMPIELIPFRTMLVSMVGQFAGLLIILALVISSGELSSKIVFLPVVIALQIILFAGISWLLSALGVLLPDLGTFVGLLMLFLLFLSPVAFHPDMVPQNLQLILYMNPAYYLIEAFRWCLLSSAQYSALVLGLYTMISFLTFFAGATFFIRLKDNLIDYE